MDLEDTFGIVMDKLILQMIQDSVHLSFFFLMFFIMEGRWVSLFCNILMAPSHCKCQSSSLERNGNPSGPGSFGNLFSFWFSLEIEQLLISTCLAHSYCS